MFKVCIISCGMITNSAHIPAYKNFPEDYEITAVCDVFLQAAKETAERHNIPNYYTDAEEMLKEQKPDIVSVCVPNCLHKEYTMLALNYGCNVMCEKPLAFTYKDAVEMFELAEKKGKILMACQSMRFTPDRLAAKKMIDSGETGEIVYGEFSRIRRRGIPTWGKFHIKEFSGGGAFVDIGVHMIDAVLWLMGNPKLKSVCATAEKYFANETGSLKESGALTGEVHTARKFNPDEMNVEDFSSGTLNFENGARVNFTVAWAANLPEASDITLMGKKAGIMLPQCKCYSKSDVEEDIKTEPNLYEKEAFSGHFYLMDNLRKALKGEEKPAVLPEETINVARVLEAVYKSAKTGREVVLND